MVNFYIETLLFTARILVLSTILDRVRQCNTHLTLHDTKNIPILLNNTLYIYGSWSVGIENMMFSGKSSPA
jgi:hypothetical protein